MDSTPDRPDVVIFPPVIPASALVVILLLHWLWPLRVSLRPLTFALGAALCALEHAFDWHKRMSNALTTCHINGVELALAPLRDYENFSWYSPPLAHMPGNFNLVVCDGPPERTTLGKRYGLLPVMDKRLARNCVIILDDYDTETADNVVDHWTAERSAATRILKADQSQSLA